MRFVIAFGLLQNLFADKGRNRMRRKSQFVRRRLLLWAAAVIFVTALAACGTERHVNTNTASGMHIAMITDAGNITDHGFNQTAYEVCSNWADINDIPFAYYMPEQDSDEARKASIDQAAAEGANIIILPGYVFASAIVTQPERYPEIKFVALDVSAEDIIDKGGKEGVHEANVYCCTYQEEISGYMAGYAAVKSGYRHLGFLGGMSVPAVKRYGYGYLQGIDDAAVQLGIAECVEVEYLYGGQFYGDENITDTMDTWYQTMGVEVVFACGGKIYTSAAEAAARAGGKVIGVDSDQQPVIDGAYGQGITVTSAMKGLSSTINRVLTGIRDGNWAQFAGKIENLGIVTDNADENYVQLPIRTTQWTGGFKEKDYRALVKELYTGRITVSDEISAMPATTVHVTDHGSIQ